MNVVFKILHRSLVIEFYKQNAAFFGLVFLVFFGFIKSDEHIAIGAFLVGNPETLYFLYILLLAYAVKVMLFQLSAINKSEHMFLESFFLLDRKTRILTVASTSILLLIPVLTYALFLIFLALPQGLLTAVISIILCLATLLILLALVIQHQLNRLPHEKKIFQIRFFSRLTLPACLFYIAFLFRKEIVLLILSKVYSCLLLIGTTELYDTDAFDLRLLTTGVMLSIVGNVALMHKYVWFQYHSMAFTLNLPLRSFTIIRRHLLVIAILLIPEIITLFRYYPLSPDFIDALGELIFGIGLCFIMFAWMLRRQVALADFMVNVFWLLVGITFLILFSVHPLILGILMLVISANIIYIRHYQYEHSDQ